MSERIVNGAAIHVREGGVAEPALVFLHYWGRSSRTWQGVVDRLGERRRVIVLHQRGWGNSVARDGRYDLATMADDVEAVAHTFGLKHTGVSPDNQEVFCKSLMLMYVIRCTHIAAVSPCCVMQTIRPSGYDSLQ